MLDALPIAQTNAAALHQACGANPGWACRLTYDGTGSQNAADIAGVLVDKVLAIFLILVVAWVAHRLARRVIKRVLRGLADGRVGARIRAHTPASMLETGELTGRSEKRVEALAAALGSVASAVIWAIAFVYVINRLGISFAPLLAGAGILGVVIGFGAQPLVTDITNGVFILIEDQFGVGDIINLDPSGTGAAPSGTVESVGLRSTSLRSVDGTMWHVPNSLIRPAGNMSQGWARSLVDIEVASDTDIPRAREVIKRQADALWHAESAVVLDEPAVWGVETLSAAGITIRLVIKTKPAEQWRLNRALRERLKVALESEGIALAAPQQTVWVHNGAPNGGGPPPDATSR